MQVFLPFLVIFLPFFSVILMAKTAKPVFILDQKYSYFGTVQTVTHSYSYMTLTFVIAPPQKKDCVLHCIFTYQIFQQLRLLHQDYNLLVINMDNYTCYSFNITILSCQKNLEYRKFICNCSILYTLSGLQKVIILL